MSESPLKSMASHRKLKAGTFIFEFDTPGIGYILKHAGCEYTVLDTEHSGFGIETVKRVVTYTRAAELPTIVRSPSRDYKDIARILDAGADGVMLPMVSSAEEAKSIIASMKYVPTGARGGGSALGGGLLHHRSHHGKAGGAESSHHARGANRERRRG